MYIVGIKNELTTEEIFGNFYRDEHNSAELYLEKVKKGNYGTCTEYDFNAKKFKTRKAAEKALEEVQPYWKPAGTKLEYLGWSILEYK